MDLSFRPINRNVLESIDGQIAHLNRQVWRVNKLIDLTGNKTKEGMHLAVYIMESQLGFIEDQLKQNISVIEVSEIDKKIDKLRDSYLLDYKTLLDVRNDTERLSQKRKNEMFTGFSNRFNLLIKEQSRLLDLDSHTNLFLLKETLRNRYIETGKDFLKQECLEELHPHAKGLYPEIEKLQRQKKDLLLENVEDIFEACQRGDQEFVRKKIKNAWQKSKVVNQIKDGSTPLHEAVLHRQPTIATLLLEAGANRRAKNQHGNEPLHLAARGGSKKAIQALLKGQPRQKQKEMLEAEGEYKRRPIHRSVHNGKLKATLLLIELGVNINVQSNEEDHHLSPLHIVVLKRNYVLVDLLTQKPELNVNLLCAEGHTPLYYAVTQADLKIIHSLVSHSSFVDGKGPNSIKNLLQEKAIENNEEIIALLKSKLQLT